MDIFNAQRNSFIEIGKGLFLDCHYQQLAPFVVPDALKDMIVNSLKYLSERKKIKVYGFVIMPNHIHLIWEILDKNGKESTPASFLKFTAHAFKKYLLLTNPASLALYAVNAQNKAYEFWQRDSMAFELFKRTTALQKVEYIHNNPLGVRWNLCNNPLDYYYSSARFYADGVDTFSFLSHLSEEF